MTFFDVRYGGEIDTQFLSFHRINSEMWRTVDVFCLSCMHVEKKNDHKKCALIQRITFQLTRASRAFWIVSMNNIHFKCSSRIIHKKFAFVYLWITTIMLRHQLFCFLITFLLCLKVNGEICPKETDFRCHSDDKCIDSTLMCNQIFDCDDHSDEKNCGNFYS